MLAHPLRLRSLLLALLATTTCLVLTGPAGAAAPDGSLISVGPHVYRVVGGAPLHITRCNYTGGCAGVQAVANLDGYRPFPRDGAMVANVDDGGTYRFVGGAALWISRCDYAPGCPSVHTVDGGTFAELDHMLQFPYDGALIGNEDDGGVYRFAGGAPLWISNCDYGPGCPSVVNVDGGTFLRAGSLNGSQPHMRQFPADGTLVGNWNDRSVYRFAGGAPLWLPSCEEPACAAAVQIDGASFDRRGTVTIGNPHMRQAPADGTYVSTPAGQYRMAGGAALRVTDCAVLDGACAGSVGVPAGTLEQPERSALRAMPADGTLLKGLPSGSLWVVRDGVAVVADTSDGAVGVNDATIEGLKPKPAPAAPPPPAAVAKRIRVTVPYTYAWRSSRLVFSHIALKGAPKGARVVARCVRGGCKGRKFSGTANGRPLLLRPFVGKPLKRGTSIEIRVSKRGRTGALKRVTVRARKAPLITTRCIPVGRTRATAC